MALGAGAGPWIPHAAAAAAPVRRTVAAPVAAAAMGPSESGASGLPAEATAAQLVSDISPDLADVRVDSSLYRRVFAEFTASEASFRQAQATQAQAEQQLVALHNTDVQLSDRIDYDTARKKKIASHLAAVRAGMRQLAVESYVNGGTLDALTAAIDARQATELGRQKVLATAVTQSQRQDEAIASRRLDAAVRDINLAVSLRDDIRGRITNVSAIRAQAIADSQTYGAAVLSQHLELDQARATATVVGTDFSLVALDAYYKGAASMATAAPSCGIPWWGLAGIAKVEGRHGTYGGAELLPNGDTSAPIVGIRLDGTNDTAVIPDSDGGLYDGDPTIDRAVGPMQFIPSTWVRWARDGNGDGLADPNNLYDATAAAADYLCQSGPGLATDAGLYRAFLSYNHSDAYANNVLGWAHTYSRIRWQ